MYLSVNSMLCSLFVQYWKLRGFVVVVVVVVCLFVVVVFLLSEKSFNSCISRLIGLNKNLFIHRNHKFSK